MPETKTGRNLLLGFIAIPGAVGCTYLATSEGPLLPSAWSTEFYVAKGLTALVASLLVLWHMSTTWPHVGTLGQRLRYLCLFAFVWLVTCASVAQQAENAPIAGRNVVGLFVSLLVIASMVISINYDRRTYR